MEEIILLIAKILFFGTGILMVGAVLLQEGKGGGLAALGGTRAETAFGSSNPVRRLTVVLAIIFFILVAGLSYYQGSGRMIGISGEKKPGATDEKKALESNEAGEAGEAAKPGEGDAGGAGGADAGDSGGGPAEAAPADAAPVEKPGEGEKPAEEKPEGAGEKKEGDQGDSGERPRSVLIAVRFIEASEFGDDHVWDYEFVDRSGPNGER